MLVGLGVSRGKDAVVNIALMKPFSVLWVGSLRAASIVVSHELPAGEVGWKYCYFYYRCFKLERLLLLLGLLVLDLYFLS